MRNPKRVELRPQLSREAAREQFAGKYLKREDYDTLIDADSQGILPNGRTVFLYLRNWAEQDALPHAHNLLRQLPFRTISATPRRQTALGGSKGGQLLLGWIEDNNAIGPRLTSYTRPYGDIYGLLLVPLALSLGMVVKQYLPDDWAAQCHRARDNGNLLLGAGLLTLKGVSAVPAPIFTTITLNHNAICRAHPDANNERAFSCLMTFGNFVGGYLCFPRLRVAFRLQPGDVLIADTNREQHGNIGPIVGDRISVVFYLRSMEDMD